MDEGMEKYSRAKELYSRAKELYYRGHLIPDDIREIDRLLTEAIDINPRLFGPHLYKGKLRLDLAKFYYFGEKNNLARKMCVEAEEEIKKALRKGLKEEYGKYHLSEITRLKEERTFPTNLEEVKK